MQLEWKSTKTKNIINYARYTTLKNHFLWFMEYENIKIKL